MTTLPASTLSVGRGPALAFSPSGDFVATSGEALRIWRVRDGALAATLPCPARVSALAFSPDARWLAGTLEEGQRDSKRIFIWSIRSETRGIATRLVYGVGHSITNGPIAFTPEGDMVALLSSASTVRGPTLAIWTKNGDTLERPLGELATSEDPKGRRYWEPCIFRGDFAPDGSVVALGRQDKDGALELWCTETGTRLLTLEASARASAFAVSNDVVAGAVAPNVVRLWSRRDGSLLGDLEGRWDAGDDTLWSLTFSPTGDLIAGGGLAGRIHVWSVHERTRVKEIPGHGGVICALAFSPKGDRIASAGWDGAVKFWEIDSPR